MKEQLRKIVREIMREKAISEMNEVSINEVDTNKANQIRKSCSRIRLDLSSQKKHLMKIY